MDTGSVIDKFVNNSVKLPLFFPMRINVVTSGAFTNKIHGMLSSQLHQRLEIIIVSGEGDKELTLFAG